ncbi:hypothetical protein NDN08_007611 [Rhodosorus marinus]|uniref:Fe2OG dioxygenase domain-containing protein n=1 Tax=Rhodosorus marinus TaxID=101924 RepID=A0AAV8UY21_9RHOD|nr:hypothetical protein NDN08_007611 [Rhodosorus marinus]
MVTIPLIDLSEGVDKKALSETLRDCCTTHGFFFLTGHGVDGAASGRILEVSRQFFALSDQDKELCSVNEYHRGYTRFGEERLDPANQSCGDTKEGFYCGSEPSQEDRGRFRLLGPNNWPDERLIPDFRRILEEYQEGMCDLGRKVNRYLAMALNQKEDCFDKAFEKPMGYVRLLRYSGQKSEPERGIFAAGAHSDYGHITYLLTDGEPGLQVFVDKEWKDVEAPPGAFICNIGDMLERWSNGYFRSTVHRVVNTTGRERYSIPFFLDPRFDALVSPLPGCGEPKYEPILSGDYLISKYRDTHENFDK